MSPKIPLRALDLPQQPVRVKAVPSGGVYYLPGGSGEEYVHGIVDPIWTPREKLVMRYPTYAII